MGAEYSYETPVEGDDEGADAANAAADAATTAASTPEADGEAAVRIDQPATKKKAPQDEEDDGGSGEEELSKKKECGESDSGAGGGDGDAQEDNKDKDTEARNDAAEPPAGDDTDGGTEDALGDSTSSKNDTSDEEVARARALAQFMEKYGSELTPEQIANITPEQIDRLTRIESSKDSDSAPPQVLRRMPARPIIELREYDLNPMYAHSYLHHTAAKADLRKKLSPLRLFVIPETGGKLNVATHLYHWRGGYRERNARKADMASSEEWREYIKKIQPALASQRSSLWMEAPFVYDMPGVVGLNMGRGESMLRMGGKYSNDAIYEVCRYKLKLGYDVIPIFLELYASGLPSKLEAEGSDPTSNLITLMYSTVGTLNEVCEVWRHGDGFDAMERSGSAAQNAKEWRESGSQISALTVEVTRTVLRPIAFSPLL